MTNSADLIENKTITNSLIILKIKKSVKMINQHKETAMVNKIDIRNNFQGNLIRYIDMTK